MKKYLVILFSFIFLCIPSVMSKKVKIGADRLEVILPSLQYKTIALVVNNTSCLSTGEHLLDVLLANKIDVKRVFAPEHGFRGDVDAGRRVLHSKDEKTGLPLISLYGKTKKPTKDMLKDVDVVIFDIQDVGARFYTYITTMHYVMEACAENDKELIVFDRPNPHDYIDGPVLDLRYKSFVGMHPIPVLYGLTIGELANMINQEGWLGSNIRCKLTVVNMEGWKHGDPYTLPIKPSPNLPNDQSIKMYASLCFFEATNVSVGRGTHFPFQVIGFPDPKYGRFKFTPQPLPGYDTNPLQKGKLCYGKDLRTEELSQGFSLLYLIDFYKKSELGAKFFKSTQFMNMLSGTNKLQQQIIMGMEEKDIRKTWAKELKKYKEKRKKYLLYEDK